MEADDSREDLCLISWVFFIEVIAVIEELCLLIIADDRIRALQIP